MTLLHEIDDPAAFETAFYGKHGMSVVDALADAKTPQAPPRKARCPLCGYRGEGCGGGSRYRPRCPQKHPELPPEEPPDDGVIVIDYRRVEQ